MIRKAETRDIKDILLLLEQVHKIHADARPDIFRNGSTKYNEKDIIEILNDSSKPIFVYQINENVVGYIFCIIKRIKNNSNYNDLDYLFIDDICVKEEYRGQNIGSKLYNYIKEFAKENNLKSIRLNVWNFNENAFKFYQKNGMKILEYIMEETL